MISYGFVKETSMTMADAEAKVRAELEKEGFGVLVKIDIAAKLKEKLGKDMPAYVILGACNPPNAYKAIQAEEHIGLMLPCNVCLQEKSGKVLVSAIRPKAAMGMIDNPALTEVAAVVEEKLRTVIDAV